MEEKRKADQAKKGAALNAMALSSSHHDDSDGPSLSHNRSNQPRQGGHNGGRVNNGGKKGGGGKHRGGNNGGTSSGAQTNIGQQVQQQWGSWQWVPHVPQQKQNWEIPPCPYLMQQARSMASRQPGILGARPQQNYPFTVHPLMLPLTLRRQCIQ